ncbi:MAG: hypothetical protein RLZZ511_1497 [Cyanobacteriota bacterium]
MLARVSSYQKQCDKLLYNHRQHSYDCILQVSQTELFKLGKHLKELPPLIVYPCVHAAGELYWHQKESRYALQSENLFQHYLTRYYLIYRAWVQRKELSKPKLVIGMSQRFNDLVSRDYKISPTRQAVLHNPIRPQSLEDRQSSDRLAAERTVIKMLFVARISVRKGLQYIIELSHRLNDLAGQVEIEIIGGKSQWSDYTAHLEKLNPHTAKYLGSMGHQAVAAAYDSADILLLPSLYEPGGIVVGEALSHGLCVVSSDAIGTAEVVKADCLREFSAGDMDAFETQVRRMISDLPTRRQTLRNQARQQAEYHFAPDQMSRQLIQILSATSKRSQTVGEFIAR